jgi:hypothetical protein
MRTVTSNFCGSDRYEERRIDYLYSHQGKYLLVTQYASGSLQQLRDGLLRCRCAEKD